MTKTLCGLDECGRPHYALGFCEPHYNRNRKYGDPRGGGMMRGTKLAWLRATVAGLAANPPQFKLSDDAVREIRSSTEPNKVIAERFGIHPTTVG